MTATQYAPMNLDDDVEEPPHKGAINARVLMRGFIRLTLFTVELLVVSVTVISHDGFETLASGFPAIPLLVSLLVTDLLSGLDGPLTRKNKMSGATLGAPAPRPSHSRPLLAGGGSWVARGGSFCRSFTTAEFSAVELTRYARRALRRCERHTHKHALKIPNTSFGTDLERRALFRFSSQSASCTRSAAATR